MTAILRFLGPAGIAGAILTIILSTLLAVQKGETRHWKKQSNGFEQLYHRADQRYTSEHLAFGRTVLNYRAAAEQARLADKANAVRVAAEQHAINERTSHDFETRIADARARAERLRTGASAADPGGGGATPVPGLHAATGGVAEAACDRLPSGAVVDWKLCATEQAIQLDELIKWATGQAEIDVNGNAKPRL